MAKQLTNLKSFFGIATGLVSFSSFIETSLAINLGIISQVNPENNNAIVELQRTVNNYHRLSYLATSVDLSHNEIKPNKTAYHQNSEKLNYADTALAITGSLKKSEDSGITIKKTKVSKEEFNSIEIGELTNKKSEFSLGNFFAYLVDSFKKIRTDQEIKLGQPKEIAVLPQAKGDEILKDMYDFDVTTEKKQYDLNSSLSSIFNQQSKDDNDSQGNSNQNPLADQLTPTKTNPTQKALADQLTSTKTNPNPYIGLQNQLLTSANNPQIRNEYNRVEKISVNTGFSGAVTPSRKNNRWFEYFDKAKIYSSPTGLIPTSPHPPVTYE